MKLIRQFLLVLFLFTLATQAFAAKKETCEIPPSMKELAKDLASSSALESEFKKSSPVRVKSLGEAWVVLKTDKTHRKNVDDINKVATFIKETTNVDLKKLEASFNNANYPETWIALKTPKKDLEKIFDNNVKNDPPANINPWTPEHKAQRWNNYKEGGGTKDYAAWSNIYDGNIGKARNGTQKVMQYVASEGLVGARIEVSSAPTAITLRGKPVTGVRRHDIIDDNKAIEVKDYRSQNVSKSIDIEREALMDIALLKKEGNNIDEVEWVFLGKGPSLPLRTLLESNGITVTVK